MSSALSSHNFKIVDAHNDLLLELAFRSSEPDPFGTYWLPHLRAGGVKLQVCACSADFQYLPDAALRHVLEQVTACYRARAENSEVVIVEQKADLARIEQDDSVGLMLSMEGAEGLGYNPQLVDVFWKLGLRIFGLTWNRRNAFADGVGEPPHGGLSRLGRELVRRLVDLGAIIDLAHASERTFQDVLEITDRSPIIVSHAACRTLLDTPRNLSDEQLRALAERDGMLGLMVLPPAIDPESPTIDRVVDHLDHAVEILGIDRVGLGADFFRQIALSGATRKPPDSLRPPGMGIDYSIDDLSGPEHFPNLVTSLEARGYNGEALDAILGRNFLRYFRRTLPDDPWKTESSVKGWDSP